MEWGKTRYVDCLDPNGLPNLPDDSIDCCFTDPPFNIKYAEKGVQRKGKFYVTHHKKVYADERTPEEYEAWCERWFREVQRICNIVVIYCGAMNENMWHRIEEPYDKLVLYRPNSPTGGRISHLRKRFPILVYLDPEKVKRNGRKIPKLTQDVFVYPALWGFLVTHKFMHTCPLNHDFWHDLISQFKPRSVIDPFHGSGTTGAVATALNIPWIAFERDRAYEVDECWRLEQARKKSNQRDVTAFF